MDIRCESSGGAGWPRLFLPACMAAPRAAAWLTEELVRQGHDVTLFASGDSNTSATLVPSVPRGLRLAGIRVHPASTLVMLDQVHRRANDFDIIHFHVDLLQFPLFQNLFQKCVTTLHGRPVCPIFVGSPGFSRTCHLCPSRTMSVARCRPH